MTRAEVPPIAGLAARMVEARRAGLERLAQLLERVLARLEEKSGRASTEARRPEEAREWYP